MDGYITLDYELSLGNYTGTPEMCLVEPMKHLARILNKHDIKMNIFVDAAYLLQLEKKKNHYLQLQRDFEVVTSHIRQLDKEGHAIQLHLHPCKKRSISTHPKRGYPFTFLTSSS